MLDIRPVLYATFVLLLSMSCRTTGGALPEPSDLKTSVRSLVVSKEDVSGIPFEFCTDKRAFSLSNALWLTFFSANQYTHFKELGPLLESFGFGAPGEGEAYRKDWYHLRLKRIEEKRTGIDDSWENEEQRLQRFEEVKAEYAELYNEPYVAKAGTAGQLERSIIQSTDFNRKIQFLSGGTENAKGEFVSGTTQVLYAEQDRSELAIIAFRGTESDEKTDILADLDLRKVAFPSMGMVHRGFDSAIQSVLDPLVDILETRSADHPIKLWLTGHSLGAALSTLMAAHIIALQKEGKLPRVSLIGNYNIGSPRVGDAVFAAAFNEELVKGKINFLRIRNGADLVTNVPNSIPVIGKYWHVGALAFIDPLDHRLYFGDGWKTIEEKSSYLKTSANNPKDHYSAAYFKNIKAEFLRNKDPDLTSCAIHANERPLLPFNENVETR